MKVKLFDEYTSKALEEKVNQFLDEVATGTNFKFIDIKYSMFQYAAGAKSFSAMIIYYI